MEFWDEHASEGSLPPNAEHPAERIVDQCQPAIRRFAHDDVALLVDKVPIATLAGLYLHVSVSQCSDRAFHLTLQLCEFQCTLIERVGATLGQEDEEQQDREAQDRHAHDRQRGGCGMLTVPKRNPHATDDDERHRSHGHDLLQVRHCSRAPGLSGRKLRKLRLSFALRAGSEARSGLSRHQAADEHGSDAAAGSRRAEYL